MYILSLGFRGFFIFRGYLFCFPDTNSQITKQLKTHNHEKVYRFSSSIIFWIQCIFSNLCKGLCKK